MHHVHVVIVETYCHHCYYYHHNCHYSYYILLQQVFIPSGEATAWAVIPLAGAAYLLQLAALRSSIFFLFLFYCFVFYVFCFIYLSISV